MSVKANPINSSKAIIHVPASLATAQSQAVSAVITTFIASTSSPDVTLRSERSDTSTVAIDPVVVIQDLKLGSIAPRRESHNPQDVEQPRDGAIVQSAMVSADTHVAKDASYQELVQHVEQLQQDHKAHVARETHLAAEVSRLDARNITLQQGNDIRDKAIDVVEHSRNRLRADVKKLQDEKEEIASSRNALHRRVRQLEADIEALERSKNRNRDELFATIENLRLGKTEVEAKVSSLIRKIAKLEREKAVLVNDNAKFVGLNNELVEQSTVSQEEYESLKAYANDLESQYNLLESDIIALQSASGSLIAKDILDEEDGGLVQPRPLDFTGLGQANVKLLEDVAELRHQQEALQLQSHKSQRRGTQCGDTAVYDVIQHYAIRLRDICAIGAVEGDIAAEIMFAHLEELQADTEARLAEEKQKLFIVQAPLATPGQMGAEPAEQTGQITIMIDNEDGGIASETSDREDKLLHMRDLVISRLCPDGRLLLEVPTPPIYLPFTPIVNPRYECECNEESLEESQDGSDENSVLGTPLIQKKGDLPAEEDIFRPTEEGVTSELKGFSLNEAPPCHFDEYEWRWVHDDNFEEEDIEAEDAITPSPTTYHVCDPNNDDLYAANRAAAYESGEIF